MTARAKQPPVVSIDWNRRDDEKVSSIAEYLLDDTPVLLNIKGITDSQRCAVAREMERVPVWSDVLFNVAVNPSRVQGSIGFPELTQLQEPVEAREVGDDDWMSFDGTRAAASLTQVDESKIREACDNQLLKVQDAQGTKYDQPAVVLEDPHGIQYEFRYKQGVDGRDAKSFELWYGLCRSLSIVPDTSTGVTMVANAMRNRALRWRKMVVSKGETPDHGSPLPSDPATTRLADELRRRSRVTADVVFSDDEWKRIGIHNLQTTHYIKVDDDFFQPAGSFRTPTHWHAPPVINVHIYGSGYKVYRLRPFSAGHVDSKTPFEASYVCTVGADSCDGNAILLPAGMHHEISTYGGTKVRIPRTKAEVDEMTKRFPAFAAQSYQKSIDTILATPKIASKNNGEYVMSSEAVLRLWTPILKNLPGAMAALRAALDEPGDKRVYVGIGTYFVMNHYNPDTEKSFLHETLKKLKRFETEPHWKRQFPNNMKASLTALYTMYEKQGVVDVDRILNRRFPLTDTIENRRKSKIMASDDEDDDTATPLDPRGPPLIRDSEIRDGGYKIPDGWTAHPQSKDKDRMFRHNANGRHFAAATQEDAWRLAIEQDIIRRNPHQKAGMLALPMFQKLLEDRMMGLVGTEPAYLAERSSSKQPLLQASASSAKRPTGDRPGSSQGTSKKKKTTPAPATPATKPRVSEPAQGSSANTPYATEKQMINDFDIRWVMGRDMYVAIEYRDGKERPLKITSPVFTAGLRHEQTLGFKEFLEHVRNKLLAIKTNRHARSNQALVKNATRVQIQNELCNPKGLWKTSAKDFAEWTGATKKQWDFNAVWPYLNPF